MFLLTKVKLISASYFSYMFYSNVAAMLYFDYVQFLTFFFYCICNIFMTFTKCVLVAKIMLILNYIVSRSYFPFNLLQISFKLVLLYFLVINCLSSSFFFFNLYIF